MINNNYPIFKTLYDVYTLMIKNKTLTDEYIDDLNKYISEDLIPDVYNWLLKKTPYIFINNIKDAGIIYIGKNKFRIFDVFIYYKKSL